MRLLKRDYGNLLSKLICILFACGSAYALPQDWSCEEVEVVKAGTAFDLAGLEQVWYLGEREGVRLRIAFYTDEKGKAVFDCGNQGCLGEFEEIASGQREEMHFYCEERGDEKAVCLPLNQRLLRLSQGKNAPYELTMCGGKVLYQLSLKDCKDCHCVLKRVDANGAVAAVERACVSATGSVSDTGNGAVEMVCMDEYGYAAYVGELNVEGDGFAMCRF